MTTIRPHHHVLSTYQRNSAAQDAKTFQERPFPPGGGMPGHRPEMPHDIFKRLDQSGDGVLNDAELQTMADELSQRTGTTVTVDDLKARLDGDGDGGVSLDEMRAAMPPPPPRRADGPGMDGGLPAEAFEADGSLSSDVINAMAANLSAVSGSTMSGSELTQKLDANGDGKIDRSEVAQVRHMLFAAHMQRR